MLLVLGAAVAIEPMHPIKVPPPMSLLSPSATYHAELREQLGGVGRALSCSAPCVWLARGLAVGSVIVFGHRDLGLDA